MRGGRSFGRIGQSRDGEPNRALQPEPGRRGGDQRLRLRQGTNRIVWNFTHDPFSKFLHGTVLWGGGGSGPKAVPGSYQVRLKIGEWTQTQPLQSVQPDPRNPSKDEDYQAQYELARATGEKVKTIYDRLLEMREVRRQARDVAERLEKGGFGAEAQAAFKALDAAMTKVEGDLTQLQGEGGQDALNFPGRHDNQWITLYGEVVYPDGPPTAGAKRRFRTSSPSTTA